MGCQSGWANARAFLHGRSKMFAKKLNSQQIIDRTGPISRLRSCERLMKKQRLEQGMEEIDLKKMNSKKEINEEC